MLDTPKNHLVAFPCVDLVTGDIDALKALIFELFAITFGSFSLLALDCFLLALGFLLLVLFFKLCLIGGFLPLGVFYGLPSTATSLVSCLTFLVCRF